MLYKIGKIFAIGYKLYYTIKINLIKQMQFNVNICHTKILPFKFFEIKQKPSKLIKNDMYSTHPDSIKSTTIKFC